MPLVYHIRRQVDNPESNMADDRPDVVQRLFRAAVDDARGGFPEYLMELARSQRDAPGCSELAARPT